MAYQDFEQALKDGFLDLHAWAENMEEQLRNNFKTQNVWPLGYPGPYPGYQYENAKKRANNENGKAWVSTGDAMRRIYSQVYNGAGGSTEKIQFFFQYYLMFVDMGVGGKGGKYEKVDNSQKAHWGRLYKKWGTPQYTKSGNKKASSDSMRGRRSRPHLMMEFRHQLRRLELMVTEYYSWKGEDELMRIFYNIDEGDHYVPS